MKRHIKYNWQARADLGAHKRKRACQQPDAEAVPLSEELRGQLGARNEYAAASADHGGSEGEGDGDEGRVAGQPHGQQPRRTKGVPTLEDIQGRRKHQSRKKIKRLQQIVARKEKKAKRATILAELSEHTLSAEQSSLLQRTANMAQSKQTAKQRLKSQLTEERAGLPAGLLAGNPSPAAGRKRKQRRVSLKVQAPLRTADELPEGSPSASSSEDEESVVASGPEMDTAPETAAAAVTAKGRGKAGPLLTEEEREAALRAQHKALLAAMPPAPKRKIRVPAASSTPSVFVQVKRPPQLQQARLQLPILQEEHTIMEAIAANSVVIICGETGCGKTTQLPQFLYEGGYTRKTGLDKQRLLIGVTEPRRIAAVSMAKRVGAELCLPRIVAHQIRYESTVTPKTELKFMTDGVLQKEIESDFALRKYSVIVIDEAHERSMHTDILLGLLSRIVPLREKMSKEPDGLPPLKLIIMSATLRVEDFTLNKQLFPARKIPVLSVEARQHPVRVHFSKRTLVDLDNVAATMKKVTQIHQQLPPGGILVFMTGQGDIHDLCRKLKQRYPVRNRKTVGGKKGRKEAKPQDVEEPDMAPLSWAEDEDVDGVLSGNESASEGEGEGEGADELKAASNGDQALQEALQALTTDLEADPVPANVGGMHVLPLYSNLSKEQQAKVFEPPPAGLRLCVVATNVAETSITIPGIRYVVDGGQVKSHLYNEVTGVSRFEVQWVSKASSDQRAGRAGRTGPGHCYRLFSSALYNNDFEQFGKPEILRMPIDGLVLQMKAMNIDVVSNFPFPTPPDPDALKAAERVLVHLNALDKASLKITPLGRAMSRFPVAPRYAKMLSLAEYYDCQPHIIAIVAALTVKHFFTFTQVDLDDEGEEEQKAARRHHQRSQIFWRTEGIKGGGDLGAVLQAIGATDYEISHGKELSPFCSKMGIREKAVLELNKLRRQLANKSYSFAGWEDEQGRDGDHVLGAGNDALQPPPKKQQDAIRQICLAGFGDHVARASPSNDGSYECEAVEGPVWIHPASVLAGQAPKFIVYHELVSGKTRHYMKGLTVIQPDWLPRLVPNLCVFSKPLPNPEPYYDAERDDVRCWMSSTFGKRRWPLHALDLSFPATNPDRFRYFARFLLDGQVFPALKAFVPDLKNKPNIFNRPWTKERVVVFLQTLVNAKVDTRRKLLAQWQPRPEFLLQPYLMWLPDSRTDELRALWPPGS